MNFILPPSLSSRGSACPDDLDGLLRAFYQAEMPHPWPDLHPPARTILPPPQVSFWHRISRSHLALAASIALLIAGMLLLSGKLTLHVTNLPTDLTSDQPAGHPRFKEPPPEKKTGADKVSIKESIVVGDDGAGVLIQSEENRY
jgi:hypothetical protein